MTAQDVLKRVLEAGGKVISDPTRPRLVVPSHLKPLVAEHRVEIRALVLQGATKETTPPCGSEQCAGCYRVAPGVHLHPPHSSADWRNWLNRWSPEGRVQ